MFELRIHVTIYWDIKYPVKITMTRTLQGPLINPLFEQTFFDHCMCLKHYSIFWDNMVNQTYKSCAFVELTF